MTMRLLHNREFACVTEDIAKETLTKKVSSPFRIFSQQESKHPHNSLSSWYCSPFVRVSVYRFTRRPSLNFKTSWSFLYAQSQVLELHQEGLEFEFSQGVRRWALFTGAQELEEIFNLLTYEISFVINIIAFRVTGYSKRNNKIGENSGDIVFIIFF